jgi:hypothetical protein
VTYLDILRSIPHAERIITKLLPPYEMKGKGTPVIGTMETMEPMFKNACPPIHAAIPTANTLENLSGAFLAICRHLITKNTKRAIMRSAPINPISSAITANIESVEASGRNKYF